MSNTSTVKTVASFVKQFVAIIKGDNAKAKAEKVFRQAQSALGTHIANGNGDTIDIETSVADAQEKLGKALVNDGQDITDRNQYVKNLLNAKNNLTTAEEALEKHKAKLAFLKEALAELETEVPEVDEEA